MRDPLRVTSAANLGAAGLSRNVPQDGKRWELAVVVTYNSGTHTSVVRTHGGRPLRDVPQMKSTSGSFDHLETGTNVVVSWDLGFPVIVGCLDFTGPDQAAITPPSITGVEGYGDSDPTQATEGGNNYKPPTAPTDMGQGDWAHVGSHGNHVAVMAGGLTSLGAPTANVRSFAVAGVLQLIARRLETITDFGQWRVENDQGRTSLILRAGSGQATQTGLDEQHWTIKFDLGATGDVLDFSISEPSGKLLFRLHAGGDGRVQLYGDGGVDISSGTQGTAQTRHDIAGDRAVVIGRGDSTAVHGSRSCTVDGTCDSQIGGDVSHVTGGSSTHIVGGDEARSVGGDAAHAITGDHTSHIGGAAKSSVDGDATLNIRGALNAAISQAMNLKAGGVTTIDGSKVKIGNGAHPMPKFDTFLRDLADFLTSLMGAIGALVPSDPISLAINTVLMQKFVILVSQGFPYESFKASNE